MKESKELIDRYVYDTVRRLPEKQRKEMEVEIFSFINDTIEENNINEDNIEEIKKMLIQMGSPKELAKKYQDQEQYLIGPSYYENYKWTLKIVFLATTLGMLIANFVLPMIDMTVTIENIFKQFMVNYMASLMIGFSAVTIIFACMEKEYIRIQKKDIWNIDELPKISSRQVNIKRGSVILGIVFTVFFIILFNFIPQLIGINIMEEGKLISYPIFNLEVLRTVLPLFNIAMLLGVIRDIAKTVEGRYTKRLAIGIAILNIVAMIVCVIAFSQPDIMNNNIMQGIIRISEQNNIGEIETLTNLFHNFSTFFLGVLGFAFILDTGEAFYKAYRYN